MEYRKDKYNANWFNHWFNTAYHLINMIKDDTNNELDIIGISTNYSVIYKTYVDFCIEFFKEHNVNIFVQK